MTHNKHFKDTISFRQKVLAVTYQQARRQILGQLEILKSFPYLPVVWEISRTGWGTFPSITDHRAALGAVELGLRDTRILEGTTARDRWRTIDGHVDLDWQGGPYAHEVVDALIRLAEDPDTATLDPGELRPGVSRCGDLDAVWLNGVRVRFRPYQPIGAAASRAQVWASLSAT